ncbi:replication protein [Anaerotignum propionicum]|nr:replication protein [Anaerotignum propionicum]AMJ40501.1 hypothetical protein CPRO_09010 [Anaerotignum propionicum DSM 1682]
MSDEVGGKERTHHTHIFIACSSAIRFSTIKNRFPQGHAEIARSTSATNRDYVFKEGKWENDQKAGTKIPDTQEEWGELPAERQGMRNDLADLYDMIKDGMTNFEIIEEVPEHLLNLDKIEKTRQTIREEQFNTTFRILEVIYIWGATNTGKTRSVMEQFGYENVFRVTNYQHGGFDGYKGQDVIIFEEFRSSLKIQDMLCYLDGYPLELPCRYVNKVACFTKVFIITNINLTEQYRANFCQDKETWDAFIRRINKVRVYKKINTYDEYTTEEYLKCSWFYDEDLCNDNPFED